MTDRTTGISDLSDPPYPGQRRWALALLAAALLLRLALLFHSQHYLQSDESLVGMIALDIMGGKPIPIFPYGNYYAGGHIIEALMMIPGFKLFGPRDWIVAGIPALIACLHLAVVYALLYRFFSKRLALLASFIYSFSCAFVTYNFYVNGSMTTMLFAWLGLWAFFSHFYGDRPRPGMLVLAGAGLGFAVYCFDYALLYVMAVGCLLLYRHRRVPGRGWRDFALLGAGLAAGAAPLIIYNLTHHFANLEHFLSPQGYTKPPFLPAFVYRFKMLFIHDLPAFFSDQIYDFPDRISWLSYLAWIVFIPALLALARRAWRPAPGRERRILCFLFLFALYTLVYCASFFGGLAARYLLPFYPTIPIIAAWAVMELARRSPRLAALGLALFMVPQFWFLGVLARDTTTTEHDITTHGADVARVVQFLDDHQISTILAPYEIKWKLMFASNRRILCAADFFGYDREKTYNRQVRERINNQNAPFALVLDKDLAFLRLAQGYFPDTAFDLDRFLAMIKQSEITYQVTTVGDYVVYHGFSKPIKFNFKEPPDDMEE